jgi:hypothetical protein
MSLNSSDDETYHSDILDELWRQVRDKKLVLCEEFLKNQVNINMLVSMLNKCKHVIRSKLNNIKRYDVIYCNNTYERRIIHNIAEIFGLDHGRHGEWTWNSIQKDCFDWECQCKCCWSEAGKKYYRINGVYISTDPVIGTSRKDKIHRRLELLKNQKASRLSDDPKNKIHQ